MRVVYLVSFNSSEVYVKIIGFAGHMKDIFSPATGILSY